jgi:hypothetical protein
VNAAGTGFPLVQVPLKPSVAEASVGRAPLAAVTRGPDWRHVPPQPSVTFWPPSGNSKASVQESSGSPMFLTVTSPWKPPSHCSPTL